MPGVRHYTGRESWGLPPFCCGLFAGAFLGRRAARGALVLGLLFQFEGLHLVRVLAELRRDLCLRAEHGVVEVPFAVGGGVARGRLVARGPCVYNSTTPATERRV